MCCVDGASLLSFRSNNWSPAHHRTSSDILSRLNQCLGRLNASQLYSVESVLQYLRVARKEAKLHSAAVRAVVAQRCRDDAESLDAFTLASAIVSRLQVSSPS
jgi:hypothetical protein